MINDIVPVKNDDDYDDVLLRNNDDKDNILVCNIDDNGIMLEMTVVVRTLFLLGESMPKCVPISCQMSVYIIIACFMCSAWRADDGRST